MKKTRVILFSSAVLATVFVLPCASVATARTQNPAAQPVAQDNSQGRDQNDLKTFTGTIAKSNGNFVLEESTAGGTYELDDQKTASNYEGKKVVVTGTYDSESKTIHVQKIEELA